MNKNSPTESQQNRILSYLQKGHTLTPLDALRKFDCLRLGARIKNLRYKGHEILTDMIFDEVNKKRYACYRIGGLMPPPKKEKSLPGKGISDYSRSIQEVSRPIPSQQTLF